MVPEASKGTKRAKSSGAAGRPVERSERDQYTNVFRALSEPLRTEMISLFDDDGACACAYLEQNLPISKSTISYHIKILYEAGLIEVRKEGRFYHYDLRQDVFDYFVPGFLTHVKTQPVDSAAGSCTA